MDAAEHNRPPFVVDIEAMVFEQMKMSDSMKNWDVEKVVESMKMTTFDSSVAVDVAADDPFEMSLAVDEELSCAAAKSKTRV